MASQNEGARTPEEITTLFVERASAGDVDGLAALYEEDAVMAFPPGRTTVGRAAIRELFVQMLEGSPRFEYEESLPAIVVGDIALTGTPSRDGKGTRARVVRQQPDGTWQRLIDRPEATS